MHKLFTEMNNKLFIKIVIITSLLYILFYILYPCLYDGWDDAILTLISAGYFNVDSNPDHHLIFINSIIGRILSSLYSINNEIEWYFIHLFILQIISTSILYYILSLRFKDLLSKILLAFLLFSLVVLFLIKMQFTTTAYMLCASGYILLLHSLDNKLLSFRVIFSIILIVYSYLIRPEVMISTTAIFLPIFIFQKNKKKMFLIYMPIITLVVLSKIVNNSSYQSIEWKEYKTYNKSRGKFNRYDTPLAYEFSSKIYTSSTISSEEFDLYDLGFPTRSIDAKEINNLVNIYKAKISKNKRLFLVHIYYNLKGFWKEFFIFFLIFAVLLSIILFRKQKNKMDVYAITLAFLSFFSLFIYLCIYNIPKGRVFYGLYFLLAIIVIYYNYLFNKQLLFILFLIVFINGIVVVEKNYQFQKKLSDTAISYLAKFKNDSIFINISGSISTKIANLPPHKLNKTLRNCNILIHTWLLYSPIYKSQYNKYFNFDIKKYDSYQLLKDAMLNDKVFYVIDEKNTDKIDLICRYYYNNNIETIKTNNGLSLIGFRKKVENDTIQ